MRWNAASRHGRAADVVARCGVRSGGEASRIFQPGGIRRRASAPEGTGRARRDDGGARVHMLATGPVILALRSLMLVLGAPTMHRSITLAV